MSKKIIEYTFENEDGDELTVDVEFSQTQLETNEEKIEIISVTQKGAEIEMTVKEKQILFAYVCNECAQDDEDIDEYYEE